MYTEDFKLLFDVRYVDSQDPLKAEMRAILVTLIETLGMVARSVPQGSNPTEQYRNIVELAARNKTLAQVTINNIEYYLGLGHDECIRELQT